MEKIEQLAIRATKWIGSPVSLVIHTMLFVSTFILILVGIDANTVLLVLTTIVSLEAIYLSIFIQMTVNRNTHHLNAVAEEVEEISEDIDEIQGDIDEIQEDMEEISEDVGEISEDVEEIQKDIDGIQEDVEEISEDVDEIQKDVEEISEETEVK